MINETYNAWFRCFRGCAGRYPLTDVIYECPTCGGLLEVAHYMDALKKHPANHWRRLFDQRYMRTEWPYGSSVWGKKESIAMRKRPLIQFLIMVKQK